MKRIIIVLAVLTIGFAQSNFNTFKSKQPAFVKQTIYTLITTNTQVGAVYGVDSILVTPAYVKTEQGIKYHINMYDNDGNLMQNKAFKGNMIPHITAGEVQTLKAFVDKYNLIIESFFIK